MNVCILILAAGASRRMRGRDKLLETVQGQPLLAHIAGQALASGMPVHVTLAPDCPARRAALAGLDVGLIEVADAAEGMAASLRAGVAALPDDCDGVIITLADLPELRAEDFTRLRDAYEAAGDAPILRATDCDGRDGHPVLFGRWCFGELAALTGDAGARPVLTAHAGRVRRLALPGHRATTDLDTPEAWQSWRARQNPD